MTIKMAINGYGRIGRNILRALYESGRQKAIRVVAINDLGDPQANAHLTRHDSVHGKFPGTVVCSPGAIEINGDRIQVCCERDPAALPWGQLDVDVVCEATGLFTSKERAAAHLQAGARKVVISAPGGSDVDATVVYGVNHDILRASHSVISNASCTTNCLAPVARVLHNQIGIRSGLMNTIHAYTNDQTLTDSYHRDLRRARAAALAMIPTSTGAASALGLVLPELDGKLNGYAVRVPTVNVSMVDLTFIAARETSISEINQVMHDAEHGDDSLCGVLRCNSEPLVSVDFNHDPASAVFDTTQTQVISGNLVKVVAWYDNEWGFSNRMLDVSEALMAASQTA